MIREKRKSDCPINYAMEIFGDRWTLLIIRDIMFKGKHGFGEFMDSEEKISTNILSSRLALLEEEKIVSKREDPAHGSKLIYSLTPKGVDLLPILLEIIVWSAKYDKQTAADKKFISKARADKDGFIAELINNLSS